MCEICRSYPHLPGCPNAPEPKAVYTCQCCKEGIFEDEEYVEVGDDYYHVECLQENMFFEDVLTILGYDVRRAYGD